MSSTIRLTCCVLRLTPAGRAPRIDPFKLSRSFGTSRCIGAAAAAAAARAARTAAGKTKTPTKGATKLAATNRDANPAQSSTTKPVPSALKTPSPTPAPLSKSSKEAKAAPSHTTSVKEKIQPAPFERAQEKLAFPERLLIYHAGTGRTVFLSCTKLSGIFLFIFTGVFIAPAYYFSPMEPSYLAFVYLAGSCIPLALMTFTTAPFVTYVHLGLPSWARHSAARLQRYTQSLPSSAEIDVTSLRWIWPRVTRLRASELYLHKGQITGAMTLRREVPQHVQQARKWYSWRPVTRFYVGGKAGTKSAEPWVWQQVLEAVARGFPRSNVQRRP